MAKPWPVKVPSVMTNNLFKLHVNLLVISRVHNEEMHVGVVLVKI